MRRFERGPRARVSSLWPSCIRVGPGLMRTWRRLTFCLEARGGSARGAAARRCRAQQARRTRDATSDADATQQRALDAIVATGTLVNGARVVVSRRRELRRRGPRGDAGLRALRSGAGDAPTAPACSWRHPAAAARDDQPRCLAGWRIRTRSETTNARVALALPPEMYGNVSPPPPPPDPLGLCGDHREWCRYTQGWYLCACNYLR